MTVRFSVPPCAKSLGSKAACREMELRNVVTRGPPFTRTTEAGVNPVPETFKMNALLPAGRLGGETEPPPGGGLITVKGTGTDARPPGFVTTTFG